VVCDCRGLLVCFRILPHTISERDKADCLMEEIVTLYTSSIFYGLTAGVIVRVLAAAGSVLRRIWAY